MLFSSIPNLSPNPRQIFQRYPKDVPPPGATSYHCSPTVARCLVSEDGRPRLRPVLAAKKRRVVDETPEHQYFDQNPSPFQNQQQEQSGCYFGYTPADPENRRQTPGLLSPNGYPNQNQQSYAPSPTTTIPTSKSPFSPSETTSHSNKHTAPSQQGTPILSPCHICHRRPTTRSVLDAYADCELCAERTCYICLRECNGPDCRTAATSSSPSTPMHPTTNDCSREKQEPPGRKVCSWCAVEGSTECGIDVVWCLDCVQRG